MFISLDLETTGVDASKDKIIEFGAVKFDLNGHREEKSFLINPGMTLPQIIPYITGITDEDLKDAPPFEEKLEEIQEFIGDLPIVGHNIQFDTGFLKSHGIPLTNDEYDTCQLATILMPGMPSYSLEILSQVLELSHKEKHRALDDAIAAMGLLLHLAEEFQHLNPKLIEKIHDLCKKTDWPAKNFLLQLNPSTAKAQPKPTEPQPPEPLENKKLLTPKTILHQTPPPYAELARSLATEADKNTYIAAPFHLFREIEQTLPDSLAKIDAPKNYISKPRLEKFTKKEHFNNYEFTSLLKYTIWSEKTKTGLLSELKLFAEEKYTASEVCITNHADEYFYKKALEKDKNAAALCSHEWLITKKPKIEDLIIIDFDAFTKSIFYEKSHHVTLQTLLSPLQQLPQNEATEALATKSTILFGLLGMIHEKYNDQNSFSARAQFTPNLTATRDFIDAKQSIANLFEISQKLAEINTDDNHTALQNWKTALTSLRELFIDTDTENNLIWIEKDYRTGEPIIKSAPKTIGPEVKEILSRAKTYRIISENLDLSDNAKFIKNLYGLDPDLDITTDSTEKSFTIEIAEDGPSDDQKHDLSNFFKENLKGQTAIVFNSRAQLEFFTLELGKTHNGLNVISQLTGSIGKLTEQFKSDPENSVLLVNPYFWKIFPLHDQIKHLYIHRLPFDPPSDPFIAASSTNYRNDFFDFQIPRVIFNLRSILNCLTQTAENATILDSRLITKKYGEDIITHLKHIATTQVVHIATL